MLFISRHASALCECIHGALRLLAPFEWQHMLVTCLPPGMLDYAMAPFPFVADWVNGEFGASQSENRF